MSSSVSPCKISPCRHRGSREPYVDSIDFRYGASCGICSKNGSSMKTATKRRADHRERIEFTRESSQSRSGLSPSKVVDGHRGQTWAVSSESPRSPLLGPKNVRLYRIAHPGLRRRFESISSSHVRLRHKRRHQAGATGVTPSRWSRRFGSEDCSIALARAISSAGPCATTISPSAFTAASYLLALSLETP